MQTKAAFLRYPRTVIVTGWLFWPKRAFWY